MRENPSFLALLLAAALGGVIVRWAFPPTVQAQTSDSGQRYVAATGEYMQGVSMLYVLDQKTQHLAVYEARGGAANSREVVFVGARNISLDTLLPAFNDESEFSHNDLKKEFERKKIPIGDESGD